MNRKKIKIIVSVLILVIVVILGVLYIIDTNKMKNDEPVLFSTWGKKYTPSIKSIKTDMNVVLSLEDRISENTVWCGTFNLIWNDLKNDLVKQDIVFNQQTEIINNLNKGTFTTADLSDDSYYKIYGMPSLQLKEQIEEGIKEKFNETSDILDDFNWDSKDLKDYFLYVMLKKEFEFPQIFTELKNGKFGEYENVKYFGIDDSTKDNVRNQVEVLYYNSKEDFAVKLITKTDDEVILVKGCNKNTFKEVYNEVNEKTNTTYSEFSKIDKLKIPNITFNLKKEITEVENKRFAFANGDEYKIEKALQTIQFQLNKKGGKIKSESGMMVNKTATIMPEKSREFFFDDTFTIFLKEKNKQLPYFAAKISDISDVQEIEK